MNMRAVLEKLSDTHLRGLANRRFERSMMTTAERVEHDLASAILCERSAKRATRACDRLHFESRAAAWSEGRDPDVGPR
jgi:hypothetical protein